MKNTFIKTAKMRELAGLNTIKSNLYLVGNNSLKTDYPLFSFSFKVVYSVLSSLLVYNFGKDP